MRVVIDTNVLVAAARSRQGASFALVSFDPGGGVRAVFVGRPVCRMAGSALATGKPAAGADAG